jgi:hypothetical protein
MTTNERRIIRIAVRFQNAVDATRARYAEAYEHDAAFDGGEFSGPAIAAREVRERDRIAQRFGFADADVAYEVAARLRALVDHPTWVYMHEPAALPQ